MSRKALLIPGAIPSRLAATCTSPEVAHRDEGVGVGLLDSTERSAGGTPVRSARSPEWPASRSPWRRRKRAQDFGLTVERMSAGENPEVSDGIRFISPSEHVFEVYHAQTVNGTEVGTHNPEAFPRHLVGVGVPRSTTR